MSQATTDQPAGGPTPSTPSTGPQSTPPLNPPAGPPPQFDEDVKRGPRGWHLALAGVAAILLWIAWPRVASWFLSCPWLGARERIDAAMQSNTTNPHWQVLSQYGDLFGGISALFATFAFLLAGYGVVLERRKYRIAREEFKLAKAAEIEERRMRDRAETHLTEQQGLTKQQIDLTQRQLVAADEFEKAGERHIKVLDLHQKNANRAADQLQSIALQTQSEMKQAIEAASKFISSQVSLAGNLNDAAKSILEGYTKEEQSRLRSIDHFEKILETQRRTYEAMHSLHVQQLDQLMYAEFLQRLRHLRNSISDLRAQGKSGYEAVDELWNTFTTELEINPEDRIKFAPRRGGRATPETIEWRKNDLRSRANAAFASIEQADGPLEVIVSLAEWIVGREARESTPQGAPKFAECRSLLAATIPDKLRSLLLYSLWTQRFSTDQGKACRNAGVFSAGALTRVVYVADIDREIFQ